MDLRVYYYHYGNNLTIGVPYPNVGIVSPDMSAFYSMVYQKGGQLYSKDGSKFVVNNEAESQPLKLIQVFTIVMDFLSSMTL